MGADERFSKFLFGLLLIVSFFVSWGQYLSLMLGILFLISALHGYCFSCKCRQFFKQDNTPKKQ